MMPSGKLAVNITERLEASNRKLTETLLEIVERRDTTELGELRRRLYVAQRAECLHLAVMLRWQIRQLETVRDE